MQTYKVVTRYGMSWANRFISEDGAWNRLLALKHMPNNAESRKKLKAQGWEVRPAEVTSEAAQ
jgi:hypothetical protein